MTTILTSTIRKNRDHIVIAISPSGKKARNVCFGFPTLRDHLEAARILTRRIGLDPDTLVHGETKQGFAFIPVPSPPVSMKDMENAVSLLTKATSSMPSEHCDPIRLAAGIINLIKASK